MSRFAQPKAWLPLALTLALLGFARFQIGETPTGAPAASEEHLADVRAAIEAIPFKLDRWLGKDEPVNPAAFELLNPNKILQRRFTNVDSPELSFSLLITHCPDERDMLGHYPPVCYPAHGWLAEPHAAFEIDWNDQTVPARRYAFTRQQGAERLSMAVVNFFVLPSDRLPFADSMDQLTRPDVLLSRREGGIAQVQVLMSPRLTPDEEATILSQAMLAIEDMLRTIHDVEGLSAGGGA